MARLNEPVVPMESIESLKRKFMRQNRDIARVNSTQSIRIRNLENEVSNLLSENLLLREQLSRYKLELEGGRSQRIAEHTGEVRVQLEEKLQELAALINGLGHPPKTKKQSPKGGKVTILNLSQSSENKAWRNEVAEQEGRLPAIMEHKSYPRKTLERQELLDMATIAEADSTDSTDSPEIGPPPVSKFVDEDPVKIDLPRRTRPQPSEETSGLDPILSINLEQRRRRKDSGGSTGSRRSSQTELIVEEPVVGDSSQTEERPRPESVADMTSPVSNVKAGTRLNRPESAREESSAQVVPKIGGRSGRFQSVEEDIQLAPTLKAPGRPMRQELMTKEEPKYVSSQNAGVPVSRTEPIVEIQISTSSVKAGGKRKLSVREDEDSHTVSKPIESLDDFKFTRITQEDKIKNPLTSLPERSATKSTREFAVASGATRAKPSEPLLPTTRKVLAPKSVNNSPKKVGRPKLSDESKSNKPEAPKFNHSRDRRERRQDPVQIKPLDATLAPPKDIVIQPEPELELETPADIDLFSPPSSQPAAARVESRDTPPSSELVPENEGHRPSRRARGAVSYAEPSLRDKMRRPSKDLTDAVARDAKTHHRGSSVKLEEGISMDLRIKEEPKDDWNMMPATSCSIVEGSQLESKALISDSLPSSITTHRKRRESLLNQAELENHVPGSGTAIAALLAETRKAKAAVREKSYENEKEYGSSVIANGMAKVEIHDFKDPSPQIRVARNTKENEPPARGSRRYSTMPHEPTPEESEASDVEATRKTEIRPSRRRQSSATVKSVSSRSEPADRDMATERGVKGATSTVGLGVMGTAESRSERMSARRRSMIS